VTRAMNEDSAPLAEIGISARSKNDLERILQLAQAARDAEHSPLWKTSIEQGFEAHGDAVEALYDELYRLLDERRNAGSPIGKPPKATDMRRELKRALVAELKHQLPLMVAEIIEGFSPPDPPR
jgi:hypothetical protein